MRCLAPAILHYASIHAMPQYGFTRNVTAAIIGAIIMMETGTTDVGTIYGNWPISRFRNLFPGGNATIPISNLRPSVVIEMFNCEIPLGEKDIHEENTIIHEDLRLSYMTKASFLSNPGRLHSSRGYDIRNHFVEGDKIIISELLRNNEFAIDLIGANIQRGIIRAHALKIIPSIFNIATWHTSGVQAAPGIKEATTPSKDTIGYGKMVATTLVDTAAQLLEIPFPPSTLRYNKDTTNTNRDESQFFR